MKSKVAILAVSVVFGLSSGIDAQLVFDKNDIDGSFGQGSILDAGNISYGMQPFSVTSELATANSLQYSAAFSAEGVTPFGDNQVLRIDVRTWDDGFIFISTAEDALNGTPTAGFEFNPLNGFAPNGQTYSELVTTEIGPNGQTLHVFEVAADLGFSTHGNPYHQITVPLTNETVFCLARNGSAPITLGDLLANHLNETLYISSVISNATTDGLYEIAAAENFGTAGLLFSGEDGLEVPAGFAHLLLAVSVPVLGDFNNDGDVDADDIDFYGGNLDVPATGDLAQLDLNGDGMVTLDDHNIHVTTLVETSNGQTGTFIGDINLDGTVNVLGDAFALVGSLGGSGGYADGDLNADQIVNVLGDAFILIGNLGNSNTANMSQSGQ